MRVLALLLALAALAPHATAQQRAPLRPYISVAGGGGSDGAAARLTVGIERGAYAATVRFVTDGLWSDETKIQQRNREFSVLGSRTVDVAERVRVRAGGGVGYSMMIIDEPFYGGPFRASATAYAITLPFEVEVQLRATDALALTLGVYRSLEVGRSAVDTGGVPRTDPLHHGGFLVGARVGL